jgi:hypothetical protein
MIPRAIITAVAFGAVFHVACIVTQTLGFGAGPAGVSAFRHAEAPLGELARRYVGTPLAGTPALSVFFYLATTGVLSLLVMYMLTNVAAARHLGRRSPGQVVAPAAGVLIAGFVLYHNVWPVPPAPYEVLPYLVLGWLAAGLLITAVIRGFPAKVGDGLARVAENSR